MLKDAGLWVDALRVCREYQPAKLASLQAEYEREVGSRGARDVSSILSQVLKFNSGQHLLDGRQYKMIHDYQFIKGMFICYVS